MNKVDPTLFITCRLCLEDLGQYQIIPSIQEKIKSCYDIVVEAFDGLPQLICEKCDANLSQHYETKQKYLEKQNTLRQRIAVSQNVVHTSEEPAAVPNIVENVEEPVKTKKRKLSLSIEEPTSTSWESDYDKKYYCRLCGYRGKNEKIMQYHYGMHKHLKNTHLDVLNSFCYVKLDKLDEKPNKTGCKDTVMLSDRKIIISRSDYLIRYTPRRSKHNRDYSDTDSEERLKTVYKRRRILSNSSGDTVVIDNVNQSVKVEQETNVNDCIQISSDESDQSDEKETNKLNIVEPIVASSDDYKTIDNISSNCYTKYLRRVENMKKNKIQTLSSGMESQLNHKVLSIGRKVLNGNNFNCTGILRFLEYKNLPIVWVPTTNNSRDCNIVIRTFLKKSCPEVLSDDGNWSSIAKTRPEPGTPESTENIGRLNSSSIQAEKASLLSLLNSTSRMPVHIKSFAVNNAETKGKILNASPVANPKQMPSKVNHEDKSVIIRVCMDDNKINNISSQNEENQFALPVITSTTSLVAYSDDKGDQNSNTVVPNSNNVVPSKETHYPKIKVKSVSELMSPKALNSLGLNQVPFTYSTLPEQTPLVAPLTESYRLNENQNSNIYSHGVFNEIFNQPQNNSQFAEKNLSHNSSVTANDQSDNSSEKYVILDTVQLPNRKTNSPFQYIKDLLQFHNLILLENENSMIEKCCLIKFKVSFRQDTTEPVILGMQLIYYFNSSFCIKITDKNQDDIPITSLSADWQWEIMRILKGDATNKLLTNANKVNKKAYSDTQNFLCLLNSIKYRKVE